MIQFERGYLRAVEIEDTSLYFDWINDPETNVWRGLNHPTSKRAAEIWVQEQIDYTSDSITFSIMANDWRTNSEFLVGFIGLRKICSRSRRAELWIYIGDKKAWGRGIGRKAIQSLCNYAFEEMNLFRIWMECDPENIGAVTCYEKAGFIKEGLLRKAYYRRGEYRDTCILGLLRTDERLSLT